MIWALVLKLFPSLITAALEAFTKAKDVELEKYKVDGTVDVAAISGVVAVTQAQTQLLIAEQGHWLTRLPRPVMGLSVATYIFKVLVVDKVVGPLLGFHPTTDFIEGNVGVWVGVIIGGYFIHGTAMEVIRGLRK